MSEARRVLLVDDDAGMRLTLQRVLETQGYTVLTADSGPKAIEVAQQSPFDIAIIDYRMGEMNGAEACRHLSALRPEAALYVMTAYVSSEAAAEARTGGALDVIHKPVRVPDLLALLADTVIGRSTVTALAG